MRAIPPGGDIRHTVFTSGRAKFSTLNPAAKNRSDQIFTNVKYVIQKADDIITAEKAIYEKEMKKTELVILKKSSKRRRRYWNESFHHKNTNETWQSWYGIADLIAKASKNYLKLKKLQAHLASIELIAYTDKIRRPLARRSEITELRTKVDLIEADILRSIEVLRARKILLSTSSNTLNFQRKIVKSATDDILVERSILEKYRYNFSTPTDQYLAEDIDHTWQKWDHLIQDVFGDIVEELIKIRKKSSQRMATIDNMIREYKNLSKSHKDTELDMMRSLGRHMGTLLEHYYAQIESRKSQNQKWYADLKWLKFDNITLKKQKEIEKLNLEQQLLKENLKDLNQGALWSWPGNNKYSY